MLSFLACAVIAPASLSFDVQFRPIANLTYELDVLAGKLPHDAPRNFRALWEREFLKTPEDRAAFQLWQSRRNNPGKVRQPQAVLSSVRFPIEWVGPREDSESFIRGAGFDATDVRDYRRRILGVTNREMATDLSYVVAHFLPAYAAWWDRVAAKEGADFARGVNAALTAPNMRKTLDQLVQFYQPQLGPNATIPFILLYRPDEIKEPTSGQQLGAYSLVQFLAGERPDQRLDVALHELSHYFYGLGRPQDLAALQTRLGRSPVGIPAYNLLNETLATALGNGVVEEQLTSSERFARLLATPLSFYNNPDIDLGGKTVFGWIKPYLAKGGTLYDPEFSDRYLGSLQQAFGARLVRPAAYMTRLYSFIDSGIPGFNAASISQRLKVSSSWRIIADELSPDVLKGYRQSPALSALFVVSPKMVDSLRSTGILNASELSALKAAPLPALFATRRNSQSVTYILVARTDQEADTLLKQLTELQSYAPGLVVPPSLAAS